MIRATFKSLNNLNTVTRPSIVFKRFAKVTPIRLVQSKAVIEEDVLSRYKAKLDSKAAEIGVKSHIELKEKLKDQIDIKKKEMSKIDPLKELEDYEKAVQFTQSLEGKKKNAKGLGPIDPNAQKSPFKVLDDFVKLEKMKDLGPSEIEYIWRLRFSKENLLSAVVPKDAFDRISSVVKRNPTFVLPLPRPEAELDQTASSETNGTPMEMHFIQWNFVGPNTTHLIITSLAEYKLHKEFARPHTTVMFHSELADTKNVVLMNGHVEMESHVTMQEAQLLLLNVQRFYGGLSGSSSEIAERRSKLVEAFNHGNAAFDMNELIDLAQSMEN